MHKILHLYFFFVLEKNSTHGGATCLSVETCEAISVFIYFSETPPFPPMVSASWRQIKDRIHIWKLGEADWISNSIQRRLRSLRETLEACFHITWWNMLIFRPKKSYFDLLLDLTGFPLRQFLFQKVFAEQKLKYSAFCPTVLVGPE